MRYAFVTAAALAFVSGSFAQTAGFDVITAPVMGQTAAAGSSLNIVWTPTEGYNNDTITITLLQGADPATLQVGPVVAAGIKSYLGTYSWAIPSTTGSFATFGFKLTLDAQPDIFQYSFPFHISSLPGSSSSSSSVSASVTATTTLTVSSNTAFTAPTSSSSASSSSVSVVSIPTSTPSTSSTSSSVPSTSSSSSGSMSTATVVSTSTTVTKSSSSTSAASKTSSSTSSAPVVATANAAVGNVVSGGLAMVGGLVVALAI